MRNAFFTFLFFLSLGTINAQELVFQTLATKGTCMVQRGSNPDKYENIQTGTKLFADDKLIITGDESYLGLVSVTGKALELAKGGVYDVNTLNGALASKTSSVAEKYVDFLMQDMSKADDATNANMKFTGSVERALGDNSIQLFLPKESKIVKEAALLKWYPKENQDGYVVNVVNMFEESILKEETESTELSVDFSALPLESNETYLVHVSSASSPGYKSGVVSLYIPEDSKVKTISEEVKTIQSETPEGSAIQEMVLAKYYEENELYVNAIPHFENAIELQPRVDRYKEAYNTFLFKIGLEPVK